MSADDRRAWVGAGRAVLMDADDYLSDDDFRTGRGEKAIAGGPTDTATGRTDSSPGVVPMGRDDAVNFAQSRREGRERR